MEKLANTVRTRRLIALWRLIRRKVRLPWRRTPFVISIVMGICKLWEWAAYAYDLTRSV
jgi:hypothetical protein